VLVRFSLSVDKQSFGIASLSPHADRIGEPLSDFDRAGLGVLAVKSQRRARQIRMAVLPKDFMVSRHAADKEVEQERFVGVGGAIEDVQLVVRMGDNFLLVVLGFLILLKQLRDAEFLQENPHVPDPVGERALGVAVLALRHGLFSQPARVVEQHLLVCHGTRRRT